MQGGADALAGNASESDDDAADFVERTIADPQWSGSAHEP